MVPPACFRDHERPGATESDIQVYVTLNFESLTSCVMSPSVGIGRRGIDITARRVRCTGLVTLTVDWISSKL